jgi:hypothetical protein
MEPVRDQAKEFARRTGGTDAELKDLNDRLEKALPNRWILLYPRIYPSAPKCGNYCSAKEPAHVFLGWPDTDSERDRPLLAMVDILIRHRMPQLWISLEMAHAIKQTTPPIDLDWTKMKLPLPGMIFMVPRGALVHARDGDVLFIAFGRICRSAPGSRIVFFLHTPRSTAVWQLDNQTPIIPLGNLARFQAEFAGRIPKRTTPESEVPITVEDHDLQKEALHLLFGSLLIMTARPDLIREARLINRVQRKRETPKEFWTCRVLGEDFKVRREPVEHGGSHSSPRLHWVMGFWRDQPYGPSHALRRPQWIEPYTRGNAGSP